MGVKKNYIKHCTYSILLLMALLNSCKLLKESKYAENNKVDWGFYQYFYNDSLRLEIRFKGGAAILNPPLANFTKLTSPEILKFVKKDLRSQLHPSLLIYSHSKGKYFGYEYIGILQKTSSKSSYLVEKKVSESQTTFFEVKRMEKTDDFLLKKYIVPLNNCELVLYCFNKIKTDRATDSLILHNNSLSELRTVKFNESYDYQKGRKSLVDSAIQIISLPGYGTPLNRLQVLKKETEGKPENEIIEQLALTAFANVDETGTIKKLLYEKRNKEGNGGNVERQDTIRVYNQSALKKVFEVARNNSVLMINESHYDWRHRYFINLLLDSLYTMGYRYLAMEALKNDGNKIEKNYLITANSGAYFKEPFLANLARNALEKGYILVPYEDTTTDKEIDLFTSEIDKREYNQALNLYRNYRKDSLAKWLVFAGYSHINKDRFGTNESSTMAKYFTGFSGINPISINQTYYSDLFNSAVPFDSTSNSISYFYLTPNQIHDSSLLKQADLYIINNLRKIPYESDSSPYPDFVKYNISENVNRKNSPFYILKIYIESEYHKSKDAVPIYIKRSLENTLKMSVLLPRNNYILIITNANDHVILSKQL